MDIRAAGLGGICCFLPRFDSGTLIDKGVEYGVTYIRRPRSGATVPIFSLRSRATGYRP